MFEPISIATAAGSLVAVAGKLTEYIIAYQSKTNTIDVNISGLGSEVKSLHSVLSAMKRSFSDQKVVAATLASGTGHQAQHWNNVRQSLSDCDITLRRLYVIWSRMDQKEPSRFFKQSKKVLALELNREEIDIFRLQVQSYRQTMEMSLQVLTMYVFFPFKI
jgi:hypothetical protein